MILPAVNEVPGTFPATLLWQFRLSALGTQTVLWLLLGFAFAGLADRRLKPVGTVVPAATGGVA